MVPFDVMKQDIVWEPCIGGHRSTVKFDSGPTFRLIVMARFDAWDWSTSLNSYTVVRTGTTKIGEAAARIAAEEAIEHVAEEARRFVQRLADSYRDVVRIMERRDAPDQDPRSAAG